MMVEEGRASTFASYRLSTLLLIVYSIINIILIIIKIIIIVHDLSYPKCISSIVDIQYNPFKYYLVIVFK